MDWDRIDAARRQARSIFAITFVVIGIAVFAAPASTFEREPMFGYIPARLTITGIAAIPIDFLLSAVGVVGVLIGLVWMWRIYRAPTRFEGAHWRFRDH